MCWCVYIGTPGRGLPLSGMKWGENKFPSHLSDVMCRCGVAVVFACYAGSPGGGLPLTRMGWDINKPPKSFARASRFDVVVA